MVAKLLRSWISETEFCSPGSESFVPVEEVSARASEVAGQEYAGEASGVEADEIVAQVVAAENERVKQAVADGAMEQADADEWLAGLEARVQEMLIFL